MMIDRGCLLSPVLYSLLLVGACAGGALPAAPATPAPPASQAYLLPFTSGTKHFVAQDSFGILRIGSHARQYAVDFMMPVDTPVLASRGGTVIDVRADCPDENCPARPKTCCANYISVQHEDGSIASYYHLRSQGSCVAIGDSVEQGDVIGRSGNTGYSTGPHLHFVIYEPDGKEGTGSLGRSKDNSAEAHFGEILKKNGIARPFKKYMSQNTPKINHCGKAL